MIGAMSQARAGKAPGCTARASLRAVVTPDQSHRQLRRQRRFGASVACAAEAETAQAEAKTAESPAAEQQPSDGSWIPVMAPEDLPKGVRKEVMVADRSILLFWYRNEIFAIASRSPAEGAYSEGFIKSKFTQDYGIICPTTGSVFSLKDGSILDWYPTNPVLRVITPRTGSLPIYPVKLTQDAILVSAEAAGATSTTLAPTRGGSDTSLENNNVFAIQPSVYVQGSEADDTSSEALATTLTFTVAISAFAIIATAGTATALFYEDFVLLGGFWALMLAAGTYFTIQYNQNKKEQQ